MSDQESKFVQKPFTPFQVKVMGIFVAIAAMIGYLASVVFQLHSYLPDFSTLNSVQVQSCNQTMWNATATSAYAFSKQWLTPLGDISNSLYNQCSAFTNASKDRWKLGEPGGP